MLRFAMVGTVGFVTDASLLTALVHLAGWGPYESRPVSFVVAISVTWLLNRVFTFARRAGPDRRREYLRYVAVQGVGVSINFAVYAALLSALPPLMNYPAVALAAGSLAAMTFNFVGVRWLAFDGGGAQARVAKVG
jgi:putative flippase GtrA